MQDYTFQHALSDATIIVRAASVTDAQRVLGEVTRCYRDWRLV